MDARLTGALVFCGAGIAMTLAVITLLRRSGRQLLAGIGEDAPDRPATTGRFAHTRTDTGIAMRGLSNLLAGCLCLATAGFVLRDVSALWDPATGFRTRTASCTSSRGRSAGTSWSSDCSTSARS